MAQEAGDVAELALSAIPKDDGETDVLSDEREEAHAAAVAGAGLDVDSEGSLEVTAKCL